MKKIIKKVMSIFLVCLLFHLEKTLILANPISQLSEYYDVIEKLNQKYDASISMPAENELDIDTFLKLSLAEFESLIEEQYLQVCQNEYYIYAADNNVQEYDLSTRSSGEKTQYYSLINQKDQLCGKLFLKANVVEAGVNQYTSIKEYGSKAQSSSGYWFDEVKSSHILSGDCKTCTVTYNGVFKNSLGVILTSYMTYTVDYRVNTGDQYLYIGPVQEF